MLQTCPIPFDAGAAPLDALSNPFVEPVGTCLQEVVGSSHALQCANALLKQVAATDLMVLITGETGTGKSLAARTVHELSPQRLGPLVVVNCGGIPESLVESELFGHEKGAFTGAYARKLGKVELAAGGTLFLDEIGDLTPGAQGKLLQLMQEGTYARVGGSETLPCRARIVAATNRDLKQMVATGAFREDLFFRLQAFPVHLPALRERPGDIPQLVSRFVETAARRMKRTVVAVDADALDTLRACRWPGNIRELQHVVERAVVVCAGPVIHRHDIALNSASSPPPPSALSLEENERRHVMGVLERTNWIVEGRRGAAAILQIPGSTLRFRMKRLGIRRPGA